MENYKVLKMNKRQKIELEEKDLEIEQGKIYAESIVDSMCSQNFPIYDELDSECEGDCIDCLIVHGIVKLLDEGIDDDVDPISIKASVTACNIRFYLENGCIICASCNNGDKVTVAENIEHKEETK